MPYPGLLHPEPLSLQQSTADLYLHRRCSTRFCLSLRGVSGSCAHKVCLSPLSISGRYQGFPDSTVGKESACNAGDPSLISGSGRKIHWRRDRLPTPVFLGFPCGSASKESTCSVGDLGSIPGLGRSPGEGKGYPLQFSGLENSMGYISPWGRKESDKTK